MKLRDYQLKLIEEIHRRMHRWKWVCAVMPTGAGKTAMGTEIVRRSMAKGKRIYWMAHRRELVDQASLSFMRAKIPHGLIVSGEPASRHQVQICSVQTVGRRLDRIRQPHFIVFDECHHARASTWMKIVDVWRDSHCLGLTATPVRLDGKGLGDVFGEMAIGPTIKELIEMGHLSDYDYFAYPLNMEGVKKTGGDYNKKAMEERVRSAHIVGNLVKEYEKRGRGQMLVFAPSISYSKEFVAGLDKAAHLDGTTPKMEREGILNQFRRKEINILSNVELFTEGLDIPEIERIGMLRPTQSLSLFLQMAGRGLRPAKGKEKCIILDHAGNFDRHRLPCEDRDWELYPSKEKKEAPLSLFTCEQCFGVYRGRTCPYCGHVRVVTPPRQIKEEKDVALIDAKALRQQEVKEGKKNIKSYEDAVEFGVRMGYKPNWARHYWKHKQAAMESWRMK